VTYQRDPNDPTRRTGVGMRRDDGSWGVFPAVLGVIFLLLVGLIAYNMYTGDTGNNAANPTASNSTSGASTNNNSTNMAPKTTPSATPATPATPPPAATPPATNQ
jgi:cytoskeletal protein RodZ